MALDGWYFEPNPNPPYGPTHDTIPIGSYRYRERINSYNGILGDNSSATRVFLVDWNMQSQFVDDLLGWAVVKSGGGLKRILPEEHPNYDYFYASDVSIKPYGKPSVAGVNQSTWNIAEITASYKPLDYAVRSDAAIDTELNRFVSRSPQVKAEYLTYNNTGMKWVAGVLAGDSLQFSPGIIIPGMTQTYTWHQVPAQIDPTLVDIDSEYRIPTLENVLPLVGKCNNATFDNQPSGCVLLTQVEGKMIMPKLKDGYYYWDIAYTFEMKNYGDSVDEPGKKAGVNYIYCPGDGQYHLVTTDGTTAGNRIYGSGDFSKLFKIPGY